VTIGFARPVEPACRRVCALQHLRIEKSLSLQLPAFLRCNVTAGFAEIDNRKVGDLALETGFTDLSYFNRSFRRRFGDTPSGFRTARARAHPN
jgi:AraC-like DNA-binding protein